MKFIHTADLHLDSPLRGLSAYPDAPAERLRTATREAFDGLVSQAIDEAVDFMVIAGDIYDGDWRDFNTGLYFVRQMGRLRQAGIPVYLLYGNHDAESEMTKTLELPDNVHVFSARKATSFRLEAHRVVLHGQSFRVAATTDNLLPAYPDPLPGWFNIGVLHTALEGGSEHARYAPCSAGELRAKGYQYWALGHVHESWVERGEVTLAWPGNIQGRHIRECGPRGALLVSVEEDRITDMARLETDVLRWQCLKVDVCGAENRLAVLRRVGQRLGELLDETPAARPLAVRLILDGPCPAHREMLGLERQLREEIIGQAVALDAQRLWIEKVQLDTSPLREPSATEAAPTDDDLADALAGLPRDARPAREDADFMALLQQDIQNLLTKLPYDVLQAVPELRKLQLDPDAHLPAHLQHAGETLRARLQDKATQPADSTH